MTDRSLSKIVARAWNNNQLLSLMMELTYSCDHQCAFCYVDRAAADSHLTFPQIETILRDARKLGCLYLILTGGEPTMHPDFFAIGSAAKKLGFSIRIKTHGSFAKGSDIIPRIKKEIDPTWVDVSIHGADAATHDSITGRPGSFDRLMTNLDLFNNYNFRVLLRSPLTRFNVNQVNSMKILAEKYSMLIAFDPALTPRDDGDRSPMTFQPTEEELRAHFAEHVHNAAKKVDLDFGDTESTDQSDTKSFSECFCGAGTGNLLIDPAGKVFACQEWRDEIGNAAEESLENLWKNSPILKKIRTLNRTAKMNLSQNQNSDIQLALFCPARALAENGDCCALYPDFQKLNNAYVESRKK